jgi:hypothetical protein
MINDQSFPFWISWWHDNAKDGEFELHTPWWISGEDMKGRESICAGIMAKSEEDAKNKIISSYDKSPDVIDFRFCVLKEDNWTPFSSRFRKADWMIW